MNGKLLLYIFFKDLSIFVLYFILLKYNLTNETYSDKMISAFPSAPSLTVSEIIVASISGSWIIILIDIVIIFTGIKIFKSIYQRIRWSLFTIGLGLHIPITLVSILILNPGFVNIAFNVSFLISFFIAGLCYKLLIREDEQSENDVLDKI